MNKRKLTVPEKHQLRIARYTLKLADPFPNTLGGPSKAEARAIIFRLTGKPSRN